MNTKGKAVVCKFKEAMPCVFQIIVRLATRDTLINLFGWEQVKFSTAGLRPVGCDLLSEETKMELHPRFGRKRFLLSDTNKEIMNWIERHVAQIHTGKHTVQERTIHRTLLAIRKNPLGAALCELAPATATWRPPPRPAPPTTTSASSSDPAGSAFAAGLIVTAGSTTAVPPSERQAQEQIIQMMASSTARPVPNPIASGAVPQEPQVSFAGSADAPPRTTIFGPCPPPPPPYLSAMPTPVNHHVGPPLRIQYQDRLQAEQNPPEVQRIPRKGATCSKGGKRKASTSPIERSPIVDGLALGQCGCDACRKVWQEPEPHNGLCTGCGKPVRMFGEPMAPRQPTVMGKDGVAYPAKDS